jgi:ankyrin repeat protein
LGWTPLHWGASEGSVEIVRLLADAGADLNAVDAQGFTPLHLAVTRNNADVVRLLLDRKADPNIRNKAGLPVLHNARTNAADLVPLLVEHGATE